jgi:hypothetical protein
MTLKSNWDAIVGLTSTACQPAKRATIRRLRLADGHCGTNDESSSETDVEENG